MYESCLNDAVEGDTVDMFFGPVKITKVKNTDTDTIIEAKFPVTSICIKNTSSEPQIVSSTKNISRAYKRVRYPDKFHKDGAVISAYSNSGEFVIEVQFAGGGKKKFLPKYQGKSLEIIKD